MRKLFAVFCLLWTTQTFADGGQIGAAHRWVLLFPLKVYFEDFLGYFLVNQPLPEREAELKATIHPQNAPLMERLHAIQRTYEGKVQLGVFYSEALRATHGLDAPVEDSWQSKVDFAWLTVLAAGLQPDVIDAATEIYQIELQNAI